MGEPADQFTPNSGVGMGLGVGKHLKSQRHHGVTGQNGRRFPEFDMAGRLAPAYRIIVHARQIVMDERIAVD